LLWRIIIGPFPIFFKGDYGEAWDNVYKAQNLGYEVKASFLKALRQASGEEK